MNGLLIAGSLAGVLMLAGVAWMLGLGGASIADEAEAMAMAEEERPGFRAIAATLDADGAVVTGEGGRTLRIRRHGARFVIEDADA